MKILISMLLAATALAVPAAALGHSTDDGTGTRARGVFLAVGKGSPTSGTFKSRALGSGTYAAAITPSGTATTGAHRSCTAAAGTLTLTATGTTPATLAGTLKGRLCSPTKTGAKVKSSFFGRLTVTAATGAAAKASGGKGIVGLVTRADGTARLVVLAGKKPLLRRLVALRAVHRFHR